MKYLSLTIMSIPILFGCTSLQGVMHEEGYSNTIADDRMLIVLSAPSIHNTYYAEDFDAIVAFQKRYIETVSGNDNIILLVDADTKPYYTDTVPEDILLEATVEDIWIRDFATAFPQSGVQFTYDPSYFDDSEDASFIQESLLGLLETYDLEYTEQDVILDGGNVVDNGHDRVVITTRVLEENDLTEAEARDLIHPHTNMQDIAIIPYDDDVMGHADGMVMWADSDTLLVATYEEPFKSSVLDALHTGLPGVTIVEVPMTFEEAQWRSFNSACGVNLNAVTTYEHIYVPTFNQPDADKRALDIITAHTQKTVHTIPAGTVCHMGGSVRCLSWQVTGANAEKLILAAQKR